MTQLLSDGVGTKAHSFRISPLPDLTSGPIAQEANPMLKTGAGLVTTGVRCFLVLPGMPTMAWKVPDTHTLCFYPWLLVPFTNRHLTARPPVSMPPALSPTPMITCFRLVLTIFSGDFPQNLLSQTTRETDGPGARPTQSYSHHPGDGSWGSGDVPQETYRNW